jgi:hypothetical protein
VSQSWFRLPCGRDRAAIRPEDRPPRRTGRFPFSGHVRSSTGVDRESLLTIPAAFLLGMMMFRLSALVLSPVFHALCRGSRGRSDNVEARGLDQLFSNWRSSVDG